MPRIFGEIKSVKDWFRIAPPKGKNKHWVAGRSAMELAKAWFPKPGQPVAPKEFMDLFRLLPKTHGIQFGQGEAELVTRFDNCGGQDRNADLVLLGQANGKKILVSVEAKADEGFGPIAGDYIRKKLLVQDSGVPKRFSLMCKGLFVRADAEIPKLRYQLLTATCGTLVEAKARGAALAIFVVHEFIGKTKEEKVKKNADDLNLFIRVLSFGKITSISPTQLLGPFSVPGNKFLPTDIPLYIGKCRRTI